MESVKKFITRYSKDFQGNMVPDPDGFWVLMGDAAFRDKKLMDKIEALQQRLTVQDQRVDELEGWCRRIMESPETMLSTAHEEELFSLIEPAGAGGYDNHGDAALKPTAEGDPVASAAFNDPLYNAESDARNASALLEEVLEWFDDGVGRSPAEFKLMRKIGDWLGRSAPSIDGGSDKCAHSEANKIGCPECGEVFK